ncbi:hypothetical protein BY996DRAFT_8683101 [Phakopsora pachyrhizi]|nr:hypothetical protein BY996DRAFT_8683101 [Phakopsora pachyrhizi]
MGSIRRGLACLKTYVTQARQKVSRVRPGLLLSPIFGAFPEAGSTKLAWCRGSLRTSVLKSSSLRDFSLRRLLYMCDRQASGRFLRLSGAFRSGSFRGLVLAWDLSGSAGVLTYKEHCCAAAAAAHYEKSVPRCVYVSIRLPLSPTTRPRPTPKPKSTSTTKPTTIRPQTPDLTNSRPKSPSQINLANLVENWGVGGPTFICIHFQIWQSLAEIMDLLSKNQSKFNCASQ